MTILDILAILLGLSALFGYLNYHLLKLPYTIGLMIIAHIASGVIVAIDYGWPGLGIGDAARKTLVDIDFHNILMEGFLCALLFAGAVNVDLSLFAQRKWAITLMATFGVLVSTFLVGGAIWLVAQVLSFDLPFVWALVFGALISPTDPVAVMGILKRVHVPPLLEAKIGGESLFNDGVGVVVFTIMLALATGSRGEIGAEQVVLLFVVEAFGGAALGLALGALAFFLIRSLDEHNLEVLISLALVTGTYAIALHLHVSGPIAVVVAGILIGNQGARFAMSEATREHGFKFWELTDEILNAVLFLLIGLEVLVIAGSLEHLWLGLAAIPIVLAARWASVVSSLGLLRRRTQFSQGAVPILTWGGLRGGISVALALSLPSAAAYNEPILAATYVVVVFSIIVQGLTIEPVIRRVIKQDQGAEEPEASKAQ